MHNLNITWQVSLSLLVEPFSSSITPSAPVYLDHQDHKLLIQFEQRRREQNDTVADFADLSNLKADASILLELIALDMEIRLTLGEQFNTDSYYFDFPHLVTQIPDIYCQVIREFKRSFCPVTTRLGPLPLEVHGYRIESEISRGGMGVVYSASQVNENGNGSQACALKFPFFKSDNGFCESRILQNIDHPNVCKLLASGSAEGFPYCCLELIEGVTLKDSIARNGRFTPLQAARLTVQIAGGLNYVHRQGIVHFDVNASNVLIDKDEKPVLIDFGLSVAILNYGTDEQVIDSFGTPDYMAPEMYNQKFGKPGVASDVYGLGVLLYEMITGLRPFAIRSVVDIEAAFKYPPSRLSDFEGLEIDPMLEDICLSALAKNVGNRIESMGQLIEQLQNWIDKQQN